ncbi:MAG: DUF975 family protein [Eubacteriales bacterium]
MWTCSELKKRALTNLSPNYWWAFLLVFLYMIIVSTATSLVSGIFGAFSSVFSTLISTFSIALGKNPTFSEVIGLLMPLIIGFSVLSLLSSICTYALEVFFVNPMNCGMIRWFFIQRDLKKINSVDTLFYSFRKDTYKHIVSGMGWKLLWTSLWGSLSIIPILFPAAIAIMFGMNTNEFIAGVSRNFGLSDSSARIGTIVMLSALFVIAIVICIMINFNRYYSYFYTAYILIDDHQIGFREALRKSRQMSRGQKGRMFILDLSFIGWWMLVFLTCGFTAVALYPYLYATYTELYFFRKEEYLTDSFARAADQSTDSFARAADQSMDSFQSPDTNIPE